MDAASSSQQPIPGTLGSPWHRDILSGLQGTDNDVSTQTPLKAQAQQDPDSVASSPMSTPSRGSIDTTGLSEEEPLTGLPQPQQQSPSQHEPPPAYSPPGPSNVGALPSDRVPLRQNAQSNYGTTGEPRTYYTFPHAAPDTPREQDQEQSELYVRVRRRWRRRKCCSCCCCCSCKWLTRTRARLLLGVVTALLLAFVILWQAFGWIHDLYAKEPDFIPWYACDAAEVKRTESFDFHDFSSFTLEERLHNELLLPGNVGGKIKIVEKADHQDAAVRVNVDMQSSYLTFLQHVTFEPTINKLVITSPNPSHGKDPFNGETPCTAINIVVSINSKLFDTLTIDTPRLSGVEFSRDVSLSPQHLIIRTAGAGRIAKRPGSLTSFTPQHIDLRTTDGSIEGAFPLIGETCLATDAGSIDVAVATPPKHVSNNGAHFHANSGLGDVHITFPVQIGSRVPEYFVQASTGDGHLSGTFIHGAETNLTTVAGNIDADLMPYSRVRSTSSLVFTETFLGQTNLNVLDTEQLPDPIDPMRWTHSTHKSVSGGMRLKYPRNWAGDMHGRANTLFGSVDVAGPGVDILRADDGTVDARRGVGGKSVMEVDTVSGVCEVLIGGQD